MDNFPGSKILSFSGRSSKCRNYQLSIVRCGRKKHFFRVKTSPANPHDPRTFSSNLYPCKKIPLKAISFSPQKEKRGTLFILAVILLVFLSAKYIYPLVLKDDPPPREANNALDTLKERQEKEKERKDFSFEKNYSGQTNSHSYEKQSYEKPDAVELFYFDPNTLDEAGWKKTRCKR